MPTRNTRRAFTTEQATPCAAATTPFIYRPSIYLLGTSEPSAMANQKQIKLYLWSVVLLGGAITLAAAARLPWETLGLRFLLLAVITVGTSSRFSVRIPRANTNVTVSDTLIFLVMLLYGGPAAILIAAIEGFASGIKISR